LRVIRLADSPAVMSIRRNDDILVAVPTRLSQHDVLAMASLILSNDELAELTGVLADKRSAKAPHRGPSPPTHRAPGAPFSFT